MLNFESDYLEGCHPKILENFVRVNLQPVSGYGNDPFTASAKEKIRVACGKPDADILFICGGTQTNAIAIHMLLDPTEGVIAPDTGHISTHEAGAIEAGAHKVLTIPNHNGKIDPDELKHYIDTFYADGNHEHMVSPGMVYITHPTEYGTLYTKNELAHISEICRSYQIPLYLDGARLGYGLMADNTDVTLKDIADLTDIFYIGGTKVGALCGEALIFANIRPPRRMVAYLKQMGGLLAKGRLIGIQFDTLFSDNLYFEISRNAIILANRLKMILKNKGYTFHIDSPTNQIFIVLSNDQYKTLQEKVKVGFWEIVDENHVAVRLATSWATTSTAIDELEKVL